MHRRWIGHLLLFVSLVPLLGGSGCIAKVRRACESDTDCAGSAPNIYCDVEGFCNVRQCNSGGKRPCYRADKGCTYNATSKGYTCQGTCKAGVQICEANGLWSLCFGDQVPSVEICDLADNDCNGQIDDVKDGIASCECLDKGKERPCFAGTAAFSGIGECRAGIQGCTDQNRWGPCRDQALPTPEICDGKDNDCNGKIDDTTEGCICADGDTRSCYTGPQGTLGEGLCRAGIQVCKNNQWESTCNGEVTPKAEDCSTPLDEDCNGRIDDVCPCAQGQTKCNETCVDTKTDLKHCGACGTACKDGEICANSVCSCVDGQERSCYTGPQDTRGKGACRGGIQTCKNNQWESTCKGEVTPTTETCNGIDDDCDGKTDESVTRPCTEQQGVCAGATETCINGTFAGCAGPQSFGALYEATERTCDGRDNDCDGLIDQAPDGSDLCRSCIPTTRNDALSFGNFPKDKAVRFAYRWDGLQLASVDANAVLRFFSQGTSTFTPSLPTTLSTSALLAWSPVGHELALHAQDGSILLLDTRSYMPLRTLKQNNQIYAHAGGPRHLAWSPDGKLLASAGDAADAYTLRVWEIQTGTERFALVGHTATISGLAFDRLSRTLISTSADKSIRTWDMSNGTLSQTKVVSSEVIHALAVHPAKDEIAVAHGDKPDPKQAPPKMAPSQIEIFSLSNLSTPPRTLRQQVITNITKLSYNRNGNLLAAIDDFPSINMHVWETADWNVVSILYSDAYRFNDFVWNPTKDELLAANEGNGQYLFFSCPQICDQFALKFQNSHQTKTVKGIGSTANQDFLVWWSDDGSLYHSSPQNIAMVTERANKTTPYTGMTAFSVYPALSPTPRNLGNLLLVYGNNDGKVFSAKGTKLGSFQNADVTTSHSMPVSSVALSPHTGLQYLLSADTSGKIKVWDYFQVPWLLTHEWSDHTGAVNGFAFAPNGYTFASASDDGTIRIRDLEKHTNATIALQESGDTKPHGGAVTAVAWSRDGKWIATAGTTLVGTYTIKIWDGRNYNPLRTFTTAMGTGHTSPIRSLVFHPNGDLLASSDGSGIRIWKVDTGAFVAVLGTFQSGHTGGVNALLWSPDGKFLYSGGDDGRVIQWECR